MPVPQLKSLILVFFLAGVAAPAQDASLVQRALANEARAANDTLHPMRYRLRKSSPRLTTTKEICETADGAVARLISINDAPLGAEDEQREQARLDQLLRDPGKQRHRKQSQDQDTARALKVLRSLPTAFLYEYAGTAQGPTGQLEKFRFKPNPDFDPPDLETQVLEQMGGELWIDPRQERVTRLDGQLQQDVDYAWGILGRLYKGGTHPHRTGRCRPESVAHCSLQYEDERESRLQDEESSIPPKIKVSLSLFQQDCATSRRLPSCATTKPAASAAQAS